jgi:SAM-dependent methyltransferase
MPAGHHSQWDAEGVAEQIDALWRASAFEAAHVAALGDLCARYILDRDAQVLEVGCGTGRIHEQLVPRLLPAAGYTGVDLSREMLAIARRRFPGARFQHGDGCALDLADGAVDYALAFEVAGHLPALRPLLRELGRVSRRAFLFTVWPSAEEEGIVDSEESIGPVRFLHRRYPTSWLVAEVAAALPEAALALEIAVLHSETWAYVLRRRLGPPGVSAPRLVPLPGFVDRLLGRLPGPVPHP